MPFIHWFKILVLIVYTFEVFRLLHPGLPQKRKCKEPPRAHPKNTTALLFSTLYSFSESFATKAGVGGKRALGLANATHVLPRDVVWS